MKAAGPTRPPDDRPSYGGARSAGTRWRSSTCWTLPAAATGVDVDPVGHRRRAGSESGSRDRALAPGRRQGKPQRRFPRVVRHRHVRLHVEGRGQSRVPRRGYLAVATEAGRGYKRRSPWMPPVRPSREQCKGCVMGNYAGYVNKKALTNSSHGLCGILLGVCEMEARSAAPGAPGDVGMVAPVLTTNENRLTDREGLKSLFAPIRRRRRSGTRSNIQLPAARHPGHGDPPRPRLRPPAPLQPASLLDAGADNFRPAHVPAAGCARHEVPAPRRAPAPDPPEWPPPVDGSIAPAGSVSARN